MTSSDSIQRAGKSSVPPISCTHVPCHHNLEEYLDEYITFRATGITAYLKNNGTLEAAQHIANHESPRTTKLYDRRQDEIPLDEVERIAI
jgi:hypothetical protein